jgi:hypothetical protein
VIEGFSVLIARAREFEKVKEEVIESERVRDVALFKSIVRGDFDCAVVHDIDFSVLRELSPAMQAEVLESIGRSAGTTPTPAVSILPRPPAPSGPPTTLSVSPAPAPPALRPPPAPPLKTVIMMLGIMLLLTLTTYFGTLSNPELTVSVTERSRYTFVPKSNQSTPGAHQAGDSEGDGPPMDGAIEMEPAGWGGQRVNCGRKKLDAIQKAASDKRAKKRRSELDAARYRYLHYYLKPGPAVRLWMVRPISHSLIDSLCGLR